MPHAGWLCMGHDTITAASFRITRFRFTFRSWDLIERPHPTERYIQHRWAGLGWWWGGDERTQPRAELPPLLQALGERRPERLHWIGTSFGMTSDLLRFWGKSGFKPLYLRQTASEVTGEYSCILIRELAGTGGGLKVRAGACASPSALRSRAARQGAGFSKPDVTILSWHTPHERFFFSSLVLDTVATALFQLGNASSRSVPMLLVLVASR